MRIVRGRAGEKKIKNIKLGIGGREKHQEEKVARRRNFCQGPEKGL